MSDEAVDTTVSGPIADANVTDSQPEFDLEKASTDLGKSLGFGAEKDTAAADDDTADQTHADDTATEEPNAAAVAAAAAKANEAAKAFDEYKGFTKAVSINGNEVIVPKSWAPEHHVTWAKMAPEAQKYYLQREKQMQDGMDAYKGDSGFGKQMREVTEPYKAFLTSQGVDAPKAAQFLLNAHYRLSTAQPAERQAYFAHLAKSYGIDLASYKPADDTVQVDPAVKALQEKVNTLESSLTAREQTALNEAKAKTSKDVEAFAADPKHAYFDECSEDIVAYIQAGHTLEQAYEKAVYANPVTRAKELARLQADNEKALREKSKTQAEAARKATATNVRSRDTRKAPTEPKGSMEDTMRETLKEIRSRTH
jgi:hypothetical protein